MKKTAKKAGGSLSKKVIKKTKTKGKVATKAKVKAKVKTRLKPKSVLKPKAVVKPKIKTEAKTKTKIKTKAKLTNAKPHHVGKDKKYMNKEQLEYFRAILLRWKSQLMAEVDRTMHHMQDEVANYPDPVDRASQEEEFNLELRARDRERKLLRKIEATLTRIDDGDYGYCDDCGAEIGLKRLEARPTANQCIECKTIAEIRERQVGENV